MKKSNTFMSLSVIMAFTMFFAANLCAKHQPNGDKLKRTKNEYLAYEQIVKLVKKCKENNSRCKHKVICYNNGRWWVCPNPDDKERSESLKKQYEQGRYIFREELLLTEEDFNDPENWNS